MAEWDTGAGGGGDWNAAGGKSIVSHTSPNTSSTPFQSPRLELLLSLCRWRRSISVLKYPSQASLSLCKMPKHFETAPTDIHHRRGCK